MADDPGNLVVVQLRGMAAILENQRRNRELITRLALRVDQGFADLRRNIGEIRSDMAQLENGLLNRHTVIERPTE